MNIENAESTESTENPTVADAVSEYQKRVKGADRKLKKYLKSQAVMEEAREEWEDAQKSVGEYLEVLRVILR